MKIKELEEELRPREKALKYGLETLAERELLAIMLRCGYQGKSALQLSDDILNECGGLKGVLQADLNQLMSLKGIKQAKALQLAASVEMVRRMAYQSMQGKDVVENSQMVVQWLQSEIGLQKQEYCIALFLNCRNRILGYENVYRGFCDSVQVQSREIFQLALKYNATRLILAHNHPSGQVEPSSADISVTSQIFSAGNLMGVEVVDHIIISYNNYFSFKDNQMM